MCKFKSGIILKGKVVLAPEGNESHLDLLSELGIEDDRYNASKKFVRAELVPPEGNMVIPVEKWEYRVDQDIVPDWYSKDPKRYENEMREAVADYMKDRLGSIICGYEWTEIKDGELTYYVMRNSMFSTIFGKTNNYKESVVREKLLQSDLLCKLKETFGDRLVPINLDLTSMDGFKDYGKIEGDLIAIPNIELLMKYGDKIPTLSRYWWLATPNQTPARGDSTFVRCVCGGGNVSCDGCGWRDGGVRPFFILKSL